MADAWSFVDRPERRASPRQSSCIATVTVVTPSVPTMSKRAAPVHAPGPWDLVDGPTLLAAASALQLRLDNVHGLLRLERLAAMAARLPPIQHPRPLSSSQIKKLLRDEQVGGEYIRSQEDDYEGIYVVEVPFSDGPRLALQGQATGCADVARVVLEAIFGAPRGTFPPAFLLRVGALARVLLDISDRICKAAGLARGSVPFEKSGQINVPSASTLSNMSGWVRFGADEVLERFPPPARKFIVERLVGQQGSLASWGNDFLDDEIVLTPLIQSGASLIVASPGELMASLRHHIVLEADELGCTDALREAIRSRAVHGAVDLVRGFLEDLVIEEGNGWTRITGTLDIDKTVDVIVLVDDLGDYDPASVYGQWNGMPVIADAASLPVKSSPDRTMRLFLYQGIGRDLIAGIPAGEDGIVTQLMTLADLETILQTPGTDQLSLWYFARALHRLHESTEVISFSAVDLWAMYRDYHSSFYLSDGPPVNTLSVQVAYGQALRVENHRALDRRYLVHPRSKTVVTAHAMHRSASPVYLTVGAAGVSFFVDTPRGATWVHVRQRADTGRGAAGHLFDIGEATAYWLWRATERLSGSVPSALDANDDLELVVSAPPATDAGMDQWVIACRDDKQRTLRVSSTPPLAPNAPPNGMDRELAGALLDALDVGAADRDDALARLVQPGPERMLHVFGPESDPLAWPGGLQAAWRVSESAVSELLDELGEYLVHDLRMPVGDIADEDRLRVLNDVVARWLIDRLTAALAELEPNGLVPGLIERNEAVIAETAREFEYLPARIACFGTRSDEVGRIEDHQRGATLTMLSSRFLIEYVAAFPPSGSSPLTQESYDRVLALASEIINKGMLSDSIRYGLSDIHLSVLASGRLGNDQDGDRYSRALDAFATARAEGTLASSLQDAASESRGDGALLAVADPLAEAEFGFSYSELAQAAGRLREQAVDESPDVVTIEVATAISLLSRELGWAEEKAATLIQHLVLEPADSSVAAFWRRGHSVWPWRFNRDRSYLRRPFVQQSSGSSTITFGRRSLYHVPTYWFEQFRSGRLQGRTRGMRSALGERRNKEGHRFEERVASRVAAMGYSNVRRRLTRIGRHNLADVGGTDLGDIDVAAVNLPRRELLLLEVKDLEAARTPVELANEVKSLVGEGNSAVRRLAQRTTWVMEHLRETLGTLGVADARGRWTTRSMVVVNQALLSEEMISSEEMPIVSIERLEGELADRQSRPRRHSR